MKSLIHKIKIFVFNLLFAEKIGRKFLAEQNARLAEALEKSHEQSTQNLKMVLAEFGMLVEYVVGQLKPEQYDAGGQPPVEIKCALTAIDKFRPLMDHPDGFDTPGDSLVFMMMRKQNLPYEISKALSEKMEEFMASSIEYDASGHITRACYERLCPTEARG